MDLQGWHTDADPGQNELNELRAPFPWFGGKRRVGGTVWNALGDVDHYVEPFAGSLAVLLGRPSSHVGTTETVNDKDMFLANFWRAVATDPAAVAHHANWPVNEADLFARHIWLVQKGKPRMEAELLADPDFFDPKIAGWWVWGISCWIGSDWCSCRGPWSVDDEGKVTNNAGQGVNRKRPHLGNAGQGVHRQSANDLTGYFTALAERLEGVRVCTGDWERVVTRGAMTHGTTVGIFLDPPYLASVRTDDLYAEDDGLISHDVRRWALDNGDDPRLRIVLAGYGPEHDHLMPSTWQRHWWSASAAYSTTSSAERGDRNHANRHTECLWMSPHCLEPAEMTLFA